MNIQEIILDSKEILEKIDSNTEGVSVDFICKSLGIDKDFLMELLEKENIIITDNLISNDLLKQIILKEPETSSSPKNLRELILSSESLLERLHRDDGKDFVRINLLCRAFDMGVKNLLLIFNSEGLEIKPDPTARIKKQVLLDFISKKNDSVNQSENLELIELEERINDSEETIYTKSVVLNQFIRSEQIREYAKIRANGFCELCEKEAPFKDKYDKPYLESHHIIYLSKGGQDSIHNVAALCPNCHRKIHNLNLKSDIEKLLNKRKQNSA